MRKLTTVRQQIASVIKSLGLLGFQSDNKKKRSLITQHISDLEAEIQQLKDSEAESPDGAEMTMEQALHIIKPHVENLKKVKELFGIK